MSQKISAIKTQLMLTRIIQKLFLVTILALGLNANALVINFDSLGSDGPITNGYSGLNWSNFYSLRGSDIPNSGYAAGVISSPNIAFNAFGDPASFSSTAQFNLVSAYFTAAWNPGQITVLGLNSGTQLYSTTFSVVKTSPTLTSFNWSGINEVRFSTNFAQFVIDNLCLDGSCGTGPAVADTQSSLNTLSKNLRSSFNYSLMSSNYANMNTYDCNLFDKNNMCISAGGRITTIDNPSSHHSAAVVVLGHKISPHIRIGGFLDQSVNHNMPSGVDMSNKNPMMGAFAVWNHQADGLGFQMKLANAYLDKDVTTSRAVVGTSEAGRGRTDLNTQSYVGELSYAFQYQEKTLVRPYFALRYTRIKQDGYTEDTTAAVTSPLTYAKLSDRSTSALMGVKVNHSLTPRTNLTASLGVEQDLDHKSDQLIATGVSGLTSENFYNNIRHTRPVASVGAYYAVAKNQRLSGDIYYQQLPFQSTDSATAYVNYMIGF